MSTKAVIKPLELDVWVPSKNVAIEYHGLFWHSGGKTGETDRKRHRQKHVTCVEKGIRLLQIFGDEWRDKRGICESVIQNALGVTPTRLNARDCTLTVIDSSKSKPFLIDNHIAGYTKAKFHVGLVHPVHGLVSVATVRTPIQKKWGKVSELARMATLKGYQVRGGASKMMKRIVSWSKENGYEGIMSYAELRFGEGTVYANCGFHLAGVAAMNYWYTDGNVRFDRFKFRAQLGKSEKEVTMEAGVRPIYGSGNNIYVMKF